jgi:predicted AAA+ superfamily ATPase
MKFLEEWLLGKVRQPLVIRGARQVGKTWLVRQLAENQQKRLIELNFEERPELKSIFTSNDPKLILLNLSSVLNETIDPKKCLLFLDEMQVVPELLSKLRWFSEKLPELALICAGSLLDFALSEHSFSMPVGRIGYLYLEPLSFEEFILAHDKKILLEYLKNYSWDTEIPLVLHEQLMSLFKEYTLIGGMPAAVASWVNERSLEKVSEIHRNLLTTYREDFTKYRGRVDIQRLQEGMTAIPRMLGEKFVYTRVNPAVSTQSIQAAMNLLVKARVCHRIVSSASNGVPIGAELNEKYFKMIFLDMGLANASLGLTFNEINAINELILVNNGKISEQIVGQILRTISPAYVEPALYYWHRAEKGSSSEIDYMLQHNSRIIPIEVKAGSTGSLKSLHLFMELKKISLAVRINSDFPNITPVKVKGQRGDFVEYTLFSLPFYLMGQLHRLLDLAISKEREFIP